MAEAKTKHQWEQTSAVLAMIANTVRDSKKRSSPYQPSEFNPFAERQKTPPRERCGIDVLKMFLRPNGQSVNPDVVLDPERN